jgi:hypothetical protein
MSAQILNAKSCRRIEETIGEPVLRGWAHGGLWMDFVTHDHRHGSWHKTSHAVTWSVENPVHYTSCHDLFQDPEDW